MKIDTTVVVIVGLKTMVAIKMFRHFSDLAHFNGSLMSIGPDFNPFPVRNSYFQLENKLL